jgi:hypothetical protein
MLVFDRNYLLFRRATEKLGIGENHESKNEPPTEQHKSPTCGSHATPRIRVILNEVKDLELRFFVPSA